MGERVAAEMDEEWSGTGSDPEAELRVLLSPKYFAAYCTKKPIGFPEVSNGTQPVVTEKENVTRPPWTNLLASIPQIRIAYLTFVPTVNFTYVSFINHLFTFLFLFWFTVFWKIHRLTSCSVDLWTPSSIKTHREHSTRNLTPFRKKVDLSPRRERRNRVPHRIESVELFFFVLFGCFYAMLMFNPAIQTVSKQKNIKGF